MYSAILAGVVDPKGLLGMTELVPSGATVFSGTAYEILGTDMQILSLVVKPGEKVLVEQGGMMMMEPGMKGSVSFANWFGRCCGGERCCMDEYVNDEPERPQMLGLTPNVPAKVIPLQMRQGDLVRCKKGAFFASTGTVEIDYKYDCNPARCCCSGQGCVQQTVSGEGVGFLSAMGTIMTKKLAEGEVLVVDTNSLVAWDDTAELGIRRVGGCCTCCCGGEGMFNSTVTGPGTVYFQSMSFERFKASLAVQVTRQAAVGGAAGGVVGGLVSSA